MACSSGELHAICILWAHVFYVLILPFFTAFLLHSIGPAVRCDMPMPNIIQVIGSNGR